MGEVYPERNEKELCLMVESVLCGILAGALGFVPLWGALKLARRANKQTMVSMAGNGLLGVFVSLIVLGVAMFLCSRLARDFILPFGAGEILTFLAVTSVYFMHRNHVIRRKTEDSDSKGDMD